MIYLGALLSNQWQKILSFTIKGIEGLGRFVSNVSILGLSQCFATYFWYTACQKRQNIIDNNV